MNFATEIKRSYLLSISLITLFFLFVLAGVLAHFVYWERLTKNGEAVEEKIEEKKFYLQERVDILIAGFESDFIFCKNLGRSITVEGAGESGACDTGMIVELAKKRISLLPLKGDTIISVNRVIDYWGGGRILKRKPETLQLSSAPSREPMSGVPEQEIIDQILQNGQMFYTSSSMKTGVRQEDDRLTYGRYYERYNWILFAVLDTTGIRRQVYSRYSAENRQVLSRMVKAVVPVSFLAILTFLAAFMFYLWISRTLKANTVLFQKVTEERDELYSLLTEEKIKASGAREKSEHFREMVQGGRDVIMVLASLRQDRFVVTQQSDGVEGILGYCQEDLAGKPLEVLLQPKKGASIRRFLDSDELFNRGSIPGEDIFITKTGDRLPVHYAVHPLIDNSGILTGLFLVAYDISGFLETRKVLERTRERLLQSQKLEAIGILSGGIAHDFNNVLSSIVGYSELLKDQLVHGSTARNDLEQILQATSRASRLVKQIHVFTRSNVLENSYFEPGLIVKETLKMLRSTIPPSIDIKQDIRLQGETIYANTTRFHQLFMNLCTNAFEAMEQEGGTLTVFLRSNKGACHVPGHYNLQGERFLELVVTDTGCGISKAMKETISESLQCLDQTAEVIERRLADDFNMIRSIGGAIWFSDNEPCGTVFHVLLPVREEKYHLNGGHREQSQIPHGSETILFVDDEPDILKMTRKMLERLGYAVHCCDTGEEALFFFQQNPDGIDLVITDQSMPGMSGAELAHEVRLISSVPVILCSGYSARISEDNWKKTGVNGFIMKPFRKRDLARLIRDTLSGTAIAEKVRLLGVEKD